VIRYKSGSKNLGCFYSKKVIYYNNINRISLYKKATRTGVFAAFPFNLDYSLERDIMALKQNYKEKLELKKNAMLAAGLVSERFPAVSSILFRMTYYQRTADPVLMKRTINFAPTNYACFHLECMRDECTEGGFDLTPVVAGLIKNNKKSVSGKIVCSGKSEDLRHGHASIAYEVSVQYNKTAK
jgi:hypothetical protein